MYLFFILRDKNGKKSIISEGKDQRRIYRWFQKEHKDEYHFFGDKPLANSEKKLKLFTQEAVQHQFHSLDDIPQILSIPNKYHRITSNAFGKLHPNSKEIKQIIISDSVNEISENAFSDLLVTQAIFIPKTVKLIGNNAFKLKNGAFVYCEEDSPAYSYCKKNNIYAKVDFPFDTYDKRTCSNQQTHTALE